MGSIDTPAVEENGSTQTPDATYTNGDGSSPPPAAADSAIARLGNESFRSNKRRSSMLPLEVGTRVLCRWRDVKFHLVKVIERRRMQCGGPNDYEYYVHYTECENL
ncbi:hypothetical protein RJ640_024393 [Escallonia rubra]|uniref:Tudor-knot domain-containing protein n=1 Tax=Escallonia rubra TaxID=112253 RepID=A0AA88RFD7_9ASTE|nr:hypothetical protein RJ640_024393 [Escallonia rubra]